jgi:hypothetical protein
MQKFTEFVKAREISIEENAKAETAAKFNELYEAKLKEMGAKSPLDLSEEDSQVFFEYLKSLKEAELTKADVKKAVKDETKDLEKKVDAAEKKAEDAEDAAKDAEKDAKKAGQDEVTDEKSFREYATNLLKTAHPDDFDEKIANKVIDGIISKVEDDNWGEAIGRLTSGLGG